jgi:hypothetical protein
MNTNRVKIKRFLLLLSFLLLTCAMVGMATGPGVQPVQAALLGRKTPTPTKTLKKTATPTMSTTPTSLPYATPTSGPTSVVNGSWKIVSSPNVGTGTYGNQLNAVAVVSPTDVWAVGFSPDPSGTPLYIRRSLVEHFDGSSWNVIASPNPAGKPDVRLNGVAAISANDIWAVGHSGDPAYIPYLTLTEHWNGTSWSIISSPSPGTYNGNDLYAVAAVASNDVWAVGWYQSGQSGQEGGALTMHWNGMNWTIVANPSGNTLYGVTALASNNVWAVGSQVILHWDGSAWSSVAFPQPGSGNPTYYELRGVSATSASDIWAVGLKQWPSGYGYISAPVSYHWDGQSWSLVYNAGTNNNYLWAVTATAPNDVWAVGDNGQTQHWNGRAWSLVSAPYPDLGGRFYGVVAASSNDVWAVGEYSQNATYQLRTWIDRYTVP